MKSNNFYQQFYIVIALSTSSKHRCILPHVTLVCENHDAKTKTKFFKLPQCYLGSHVNPFENIPDDIFTFMKIFEHFGMESTNKMYMTLLLRRNAILDRYRMAKMMRMVLHTCARMQHGSNGRRVLSTPPPDSACHKGVLQVHIIIQLQIIEIIFNLT